MLSPFGSLGGHRFGDPATRPGAPELLVTATDLCHGTAFEFSPDQVGAMCIDWRDVPLSLPAEMVPTVAGMVPISEGRCP